MSTPGAGKSALAGMLQAMTLNGSPIAKPISISGGSPVAPPTLHLKEEKLNSASHLVDDDLEELDLDEDGLPRKLPPCTAPTSNGRKIFSLR